MSSLKRCINTAEAIKVDICKGKRTIKVTHNEEYDSNCFIETLNDKSISCQ